jgi:uncharacterized protein (TIGR02598 family)
MKHFINNFQSCRLLPAPKTLAGKPSDHVKRGSPALETSAGELPLSVSRSALRAPARNATPAAKTAGRLSGWHGVAGGPRSTIAFTLVEVMIAVAVVTMGIVAVLGLIPVSLKSARDAADNTLAATIVQDIFTGVRSTFMTYSTNTMSSTSVDLSTIPSGTVRSDTLYFDIAGNQINAAGPDSYYEVDLTYVRQYDLPTLYRATAVVTWPAHASGVTPSSLPGSTFVTEVARFGP